MVGRPHGSRRPLDQACTPSAGDGLPRSPASVNTDEWKRSPYPALMTAEQFEFVQQRLERNGRLSPRNPRRPSLLRAPCPPRGRLRLYRCSTRSKHRILREYCRCSRDRRSAPARRLCLRQPAGALRGDRRSRLDTGARAASVGWTSAPLTAYSESCRAHARRFWP